MTVLVLTEPDDDTASRVCNALAGRSCAYLRADLGAFPASMSITGVQTGTGWTGTLQSGDQDLALAEIESVYWRRPTAFRFPAELDAQQRRFATAEARQGLGGLISGLPVPFVNHPARIADAEMKPVQLQIAAQVGFRVPPTLITTDAAAARAFLQRHRRVLYKPFTAAFPRLQNRVQLVYATEIATGDLLDDAAIAATPCQFQAFVDKAHDVRLVAVGCHRFAIAIYAGSDAAHIDFRADYPSLTYAAVPVPAQVDDAVTAYLGRFGLVFGCFDFAVDQLQRWWFLECGANAQWGWLQHETGLPIAEAIAEQLHRPAATASGPGARMSA